MQLNRGELEATTNVEVRAIDFAELLAATIPKITREAIAALRVAADAGIARRMAIAGEHLLTQLGPAGYLSLARHRSDTVRGWAAFLLAAAPHFTLGERLQLIRPLANDRNSGVREWAWLALRPLLAGEIELAIDMLEPWTVSSSPFLRRFACEVTRPRGARCVQIDALKQEPDLGLPILEPLRADPHRYVQDSVASWLNDAAKSQPEWVRQTCLRWQDESASPATARICSRAQRHLFSTERR